MQSRRIEVRALTEGIEAYRYGQPRTTCPYELDTREHSDWLLGWDEAAKVDHEDHPTLN
ncbi:ribosome modulation factor [Mesorhizobium sp. BAC0120]|uniref:ribosome modulation factor n=1 Tax=Mesorhizobium sp. BAC0120 TaxID=3090670 RepID=UPI003999714A